MTRIVDSGYFIYLLSKFHFVGAASGTALAPIECRHGMAEFYGRKIPF
jgi:hypothetical protein